MQKVVELIEKEIQSLIINIKRRRLFDLRLFFYYSGIPIWIIPSTTLTG